MIAAFMPLIFFVLMSAFVFYIACRSHSAFKFEFNSNGFESIKRFQKKKNVFLFPNQSWAETRPARSAFPFPTLPHGPFFPAHLSCELAQWPAR
jgi:hypothetical protein